MGKIYKNQTALKLTTTVSQDISGAACLIKYRKPSGVTGSFSAAIEDAATGVFSYTVTSANDIDESGKWRFWGYVTFRGGKVAPGEVYKKQVYNEGE